MHSERSFRNQLQGKLFKSQLHKPGKKIQNTSQHSYKSPREYYRTNELSKLNLAPLFSTPKEAFFPLLHEVTVTLLQLLYGHLDLEKKFPRWEYRLVDEWLKKKSPQTFSDLFPNDPELSLLFYQLLRGTHSYDLEKRKGIAPLTDFMRFSNSKNDQAVHFAFSSKILLIALFGQRATLRVMEEEKKKWEIDNKRIVLRKDELEKILLEKSEERQNLNLLLPLLSFSSKAKLSPQITSSDKASEICFTRKI